MKLANWLMIPGLLLVACGSDKQQNETIVVAWPGMTVADFNQLNRGSVEPLRLDDSDLGGVNSPVLIVFKLGRESVSFLDTTRAGGLKLTSGDYNISSDVESGVRRITTMNFNIGSSMERIAERLPVVLAKCNRLAALAGLSPAVLLDAATLSRRLADDKDEIEICAGRGDRFRYQVSAFHHRTHHAHGGDFRYASFLVFLGEPL